MLIGLIGESPNDTQSLENLLSKKYPKLKFKELIRNITGSNLDHISTNEKNKKLLEAELKGKKYELIIYTRDLDALENNKQFLRQKNKIFRELNSLIQNKGIFLLNIYEIEALIWADINSINIRYSLNIIFSSDPMKLEEPKEALKKHLNWFTENDTPKIFSHLDINNIIKNCRYFKQFISDFDKRLSLLKPTKIKNKTQKRKRNIKK